MQPGYNPDTVVIGTEVPTHGQFTTTSGWNMELKDILLSFDGRINRQRWWLIGIALNIAAVVYGFVVAMVIFAIESDIVWGIVFSIAMSPFYYVYVALDIKRLQDTGRSWEWGWLSVVSYLVVVIYNCTPVGSSAESVTDWLSIIITIPIWIICGFFEGDALPNQHGPNPLGSYMNVAPSTEIPVAVYKSEIE